MRDNYTYRIYNYTGNMYKSRDIYHQYILVKKLAYNIDIDKMDD